MTADNVDAVMTLALARDFEVASRLEAEVRDAWERKAGFRHCSAYIWAVFWIKQEQATPFLIDCLQQGDESMYPALACLGRIAFLQHDFTTADEAVNQWTDWWNLNAPKKWDEHFRIALVSSGVDIQFEDAEEITSDELLSLAQTFPLRASPYFLIQRPSDLPSRPTLIAMRISELLSHRDKNIITPLAFPLGHPDRSLDFQN